MAAFERILVTGGAGFVGGHLCAALAKAYPQAARALLLRPGERGGHEGFEAAAADLVDEAAIDALIAKLRPDLIVHLAGQSSINRALHAGETTWRVNFHGTFALGAATARHCPAAVFLFASSASVYGESFRDGVLSEEAPVRPVDAYSRSKVAAEHALADLRAPEGRLIVARPVNHSGPGQRNRNFALAWFAAQIAAIEAGRVEPLIKVGDLSKARDFLDVRDVVDAYMRLIEKACDLPQPESIFNIASGKAHRMASLLERMRARSDAQFGVEVDPALLRPESDVASVACDATKLTEATGWRPRHDIDGMLQALLDDARATETHAAEESA
ncbi:GDP-mannose 4,6-dehydratase [Methylocystis sp. B8]|uniref:NAD-dependent epimerase/dehydratase family protein n=1 Tax=Methylocystis sp. B8 TaxID=544938 RepID=UPI0010FF3BCF|nr:GDP-mannose 4,6-dehydratase [Methylocystis sp. B8]TLG76959.1 NAD-dependent epimerase/dehydratase family protein [Methylocystis sp. B8]